MKRQLYLISSTLIFFIISFSHAHQEPESLHIGPYLQNVSQHSIVIMWETTIAAIGIVDYGLSPENLDSFVKEAEAKTTNKNSRSSHNSRKTKNQHQHWG